jgi:hypothetical protein
MCGGPCRRTKTQGSLAQQQSIHSVRVCVYLLVSLFFLSSFIFVAHALLFVAVVVLTDDCAFLLRKRGGGDSSDSRFLL